MFLDEVCAVQGCTRAAAMFCFECEVWFCRAHLTQMALVVKPVHRETLVCPSCLEGHLYAPRYLRELLFESVGHDPWDASLEAGDDFAL